MSRKGTCPFAHANARRSSLTLNFYETGRICSSVVVWIDKKEFFYVMLELETISSVVGFLKK